MQIKAVFIAAIGLFLTASHGFALKEVRVGSYSYPPLISHDSKGETVGIFPAILDDFARRAKLKIVYVYGTWEENLQWLKSGEIDLAAGISQARGRSADFSVNQEPVLFSWSQLYSRKGNKAISLFDLQGEQVAALLGDTSTDAFKEMLASFGIQAEFVEVGNIEQAFQLVSKGEAVAAISERITSQVFERKYPVERNPVIFSPQSLAFGTAKGKNQDLLDALDRYIRKEKAYPGSRYQKILANWKDTEPESELPAYILWALLGVVGLLVFSVGGNMLLKAQIRRNTAELSRQNLELQGEIVERKRIQDELKQAKEAAESANQAKDQFIAVLSHELRTPLTPILATVTARDAAGSPPVLTPDDCELIRRNVELEARLVDDLLDVTRINHGKIKLQMETVDAHVCLKNVLDICRREIEAGHLEVLLDLKASRHHLQADSTRLQQVVWNLVNNAVKFTPPNGRISVRTANIGDRLTLEIADTGIGVEPEILSRLFKPFEQGEQSKSRRFGGLGLGLNIAKAIVEMHHGTIACFSEGSGKGTTFRVELDTVPEVSASASPLAVPMLRQEQLRRILLVDDHADTLRTLSRLLQRWGYSVVTADCVRGALELATGEPFDLLISDLGLPDGSGLDIMRQLKDQSGMQGIALSGYGTDEDLRLSREAGFAEHLIKPINFQTLHTVIQQILSDVVVA